MKTPERTEIKVVWIKYSLLRLVISGGFCEMHAQTQSVHSTVETFHSTDVSWI